MKLAGSAFLFPIALGACLAAQASDTPADTAQTASSAESGMVAGISPATGALRPLSDAEISALSEKANNMASRRSTSNAAWARMPQTGADAAKTFRRHANGMTTAVLPLSAMNALTIERAADGSLTVLENGSPLDHNPQQVSQ